MNNFYMREKINEKKYLFLKNLSDFLIDWLKSLCDDINKSFIVIWKVFFQSAFPV